MRQAQDQTQTGRGDDVQRMGGEGKMNHKTEGKGGVAFSNSGDSYVMVEDYNETVPVNRFSIVPHAFRRWLPHHVKVQIVT